MEKRLKSILTDDMGHCYITGNPNVAIHHVFPGTGRREICEKYGFVVPLSPELHNASDDSVHNNPNVGLDLILKERCQRYFESNFGTREDFISIFGKSYIW